MKKTALFALATLFVTSVFADSVPASAKRYGTWGVDLEGMDRAVKPGDDFFRYVNGHWVATTQIPADKTSYGAFPMLFDLSEQRVRGIVE